MPLKGVAFFHAVAAELDHLCNRRDASYLLGSGPLDSWEELVGEAVCFIVEPAVG